MIEAPMPQDILKYKAKFVANFSAREAGCLAVSAVLSLGGYFSFLSGIPSTPRMYVAALLAVPFLVFGFVKPLGQPFEKVAAQVVYDNLICPPIRRNEIRRPEYERFLKDGLCSDNKEEQGHPAKSSKKEKKGEIKVAKSKEYPGIK